MQITACPIALPLGKLAAIAWRAKHIAVHCSATRPTALMGVRDIHRMHVERGFACIGYHYVIKRDGTIERGRPEDKMGAHVEGHNRDSLGVCLIGGIDADGKAEEQFHASSNSTACKSLLTEPPWQISAKAVIQGHRDFFGDSERRWQD
jgi:N-acetylmuramoyl-L-alanine amidase